MRGRRGNILKHYGLFTELYTKTINIKGIKNKNNEILFTGLQTTITTSLANLFLQTCDNECSAKNYLFTVGQGAQKVGFWPYHILQIPTGGSVEQYAGYVVISKHKIWYSSCCNQRKTNNDFICNFVSK